MQAKRKIILGITASVAIYKSCDLIRRLNDEGYDVTVVMTADAKKLLGPSLLQALSGNKVYSDLFEEPESWEIRHVSLADKADIVLVSPATANIIAKVSAGICDDLLTCLILATKSQVVFCPAMNDNMYNNPLTKSNISKLAKLGYKFVGPKQGKLACGRQGTGCLADVETILSSVKNLLKNKSR